MNSSQTPRLHSIKKKIKNWIKGEDGKSKTRFVNEVAEIKELIKKKDALKVYTLSIQNLKKAPNNEFFSYAAAWAASTLGKFIETPRLINAAIAAAPNNIKYLSLRGTAYLKLGLYKEAHPDFEALAVLKPDDPAIWKGLLKIRSALKIDVAPPRILTVITDEINNAYSLRDWTRFDHLLDELKKMEPVTAHYWETVKNDFLTRLGDPATEWSLVHAECREANNELAYNAFSNMINSLIKTGELNRVLPELPKFKMLYDKPCPVMFVPGICALFVRNKMYELCLDFLAGIEAAIIDNNIKQTLIFKTYAYRWICREALGLKQKSELAHTSNEISISLMKNMQEAHYPESAAALTVNECVTCWNTIEKSTNRLLDFRYKPEQISILKSKIANALVNKNPLSLVRIMDGESYGFIQYSTEAKFMDIRKASENLWWGRTIDESLKQKVANGFLAAVKSADIIGFPYALRLAQELAVEKRSEPQMKEIKYQTIFQGVKKLLDTKQISPDITWVDEFCSFALTDESYISDLIQKAENIVLVTCFKIPKFHIFDHPKVHVVTIPPHTKVASICETPFNNKVLPEVMDDIEKQIIQQTKPGTLLLVSAGFAGKMLMDIGKKSGAVAIDFGAALDDMLGFKTRSIELHAQFSYPRRKEICISTQKGTERKDVVTNVFVQLEDLSKAPNLKWRNLYAGNRQRFSLATGVKLLSPNTLIVSTLLGRKMYLVRFDIEMGTHQVIDSITTMFNGETTETDLLDIDGKGNIFTSNCSTGSLSQYRYENDKILFVKDIPMYDKTFIHGVKVFKPNIVAASIIREPMGVHLYDLDAMKVLLYIPTETRSKDVCFLSDTRVVILGTFGKLTGQADEGYDSELQLVDFNLQNGTYKVIKRVTFKGAHFDCVVHHDGKLYVNEQFKDCIFIVDPNNLEQIGEISGYSFPHGIDIRYGLMAVTNYGSNSVDIRTFPTI